MDSTTTHCGQLGGRSGGVPCTYATGHTTRHSWHDSGKESQELGDAVVRMMRGLVTRAAAGDTTALEQLQRLEQLAPAAVSLGAQLAHEGPARYSWTTLADVLGITRQGARQRCSTTTLAAKLTNMADLHKLTPGHSATTCARCRSTQRREAREARGTNR